MNCRKRGLALVLALGILLLTTPATFASPEMLEMAEQAYGAGNLYPVYSMPDTITVFGFGSSKGTPDGAWVDIGLTARGATAERAQEVYRQIRAMVMDALGDEGVEEERVSNLYFSLWPTNSGYGWEESGYRVNSGISVRLDAPQKVPSIVDAALAAGADRIEGIRYFTSNEKQLQERALREAVRDGYQRAQMIARALDRELGKLLLVDQGTAPPYQLWQENLLPRGGDIQQGTLEVTQYLRLVYQLD